MEYTQLVAIYNKMVGKKEVLDKQLGEFQEDAKKQERRLLAIEKTQALIQKTAQETQEQLRYHIEDIVRSAMDAVFPDVYDFAVEFEIKRNKTEANLKFTKDGFDIDVMNSSGGGVVDAASLGLRLAAWSLGNSNNVLILDESLKFLSADLVPRMAEVLQELSTKLNLQIIMVSHSSGLIQMADMIYTVEQKGGVSCVSLKQN